MSHLNYLNSPYPDNFQELCASMPLFYLDVFEMREILKAQATLMDGVCDSFELVLANNFIIPADEATIKKWETALKIVYEEELTLEQRKQAVISRITGFGHIGEPEIRAIIACYTAGGVSVAFSKGIIYIEIEGEVPGEATMYDTLLGRIPAHLRLKMQINIRRKFRQELDFSYGGGIVTKFDTQPVGEDRTARSTLNIGYGGEVFTGFKPQPVSEDRTARTEIPFGYGGEIATSFKPLPVGEDRIAAAPLPVAHGAYLEAKQAGDTPATHRSATGRTDGAGGLFYHTHTKSKLIE